MPSYAGVNQAKLFRENSQIFLWQNETVPASATVGSLSIAVQLERVRSVSYPWGFSVEVAFSGAPGTFEIDVMGADTDNPNYYIKIGSITATNPSNVGRFDGIGPNLTYPKYVALYMKALGNAVAVTAQLTSTFTASQAGQWLFYTAGSPCVDIVLNGGYYPNAYSTPVTITGVCPSGAGSGVSQIIAGTNIGVSPITGTGPVTITNTGIPSGTGVVAVNSGVSGIATPQVTSPLTNGLIPYRGVFGLGDSTYQGCCVDNATDDFLADLSKDIPGYRYNLGESGAWTSDVTTVAWLNWPLLNQNDFPFVVYEGGINNANYTNGINYVQQSYQDTVAGITHIDIPLNLQQLSSTAASSSGWTPVTGIVAFGINPAMTGTFQQSTTSGTTVTYTLPAGANVVYWWGAATTSAGTANVSLNGTLQTNYCTGNTTFNAFGCNGQVVASDFGGGYAIFGQVFGGGNTSSSNILTVTVTSATGSGNTYFDGGAATVPSTFQGVIGLQGVIPQYLGANATATAAYNTTIQSAYTALAAHGFSNLFFADVRNGVPAGPGNTPEWPAARPINTTTDFVGGVNCPGGLVNLHLDSCGYKALAQIIESAAAAAGYPAVINNVGGSNMVNAPLIYYTGLQPFVNDFRYDVKMNPMEVYSSSTRMPGICLSGGSLINGDLNTKCNTRISFEQDQNLNIGSTRFLLENTQYPWTFALGSAGITQNPATDTDYVGIYAGTLGNFFNTTSHFGSTGVWLSGVYPSQTAPFTTQSSAFGYSVESSGTATSNAATNNMTYVLLPTGTTNYPVPLCNTSASNSFGNWVQFVLKDNADTGTFTFTPASGDKLNGSTGAISLTAVQQNTLWMLRCNKVGSSNTNIFMQEIQPIPTIPTITTGTPAVGQASCIKAAGPPVVIGYCSTVVSSSGACTCN
ncbi:unnamed protein product [Sphagnum jensenii]